MTHLLFQKFIDYLFHENTHEIKFCCLDPNSLEQKWHFIQYIHEIKKFNCNARNKLLTETRAEIDSLPFNDAYYIIVEIAKELIKKNYSFYIFYARGQRSPHLIIYDIQEFFSVGKIKLNSYQRLKLQKRFWKKIAKRNYDFLDKSIWQDEVPVALEFRDHWKHKTPFLPIFCYNKEAQKCNI